jgi:hypothetical protein
VRHLNQKKSACHGYGSFKQGRYYEMAALPQKNTPNGSAPGLVHSPTAATVTQKQHFLNNAPDFPGAKIGDRRASRIQGMAGDRVRHYRSAAGLD